MYVCQEKHKPEALMKQRRWETTTIDDKEISCYIYCEFGSSQQRSTSLSQKDKM